MSFDFKSAIADAKKEYDNVLVSAIVLGPSGAGKSSIMGTFGVKTLYLYTSGESHGPKSARTLGGDNIVPICIDQDAGKSLGPDAAYSRLLDILNSSAAIKQLGVGAVTLDGASELENIIRGTDKWAKACLTDKGKHNTFGEGAATANMFRAVTAALRNLQLELGVHYAVSCILDVKTMGPNGAIEEATPRLTGYSVAESLVQQFGDVLVVGRMERDDVVKHKIQFMSDVTKVSKDALGTVKKAVNFAPRLAGVQVQDLPPFMDADLAGIVKLKKEKLK